MSDLDYDAHLTKVELGDLAVAYGWWKAHGDPEAFNDTLNAAVERILRARLLDLAQHAEADRAAVERVRALTDDLWRAAPCGCGHRADLHTMGGIDGVSVCTGGLGICGCDWSFVRIVQQRIRDTAALDPKEDQ